MGSRMARPAPWRNWTRWDLYSRYVRVGAIARLAGFILGLYLATNN